MSEHPPIAVGLGEVLWDLLPTGKQLGGAPANFAYHAQALGAKSHVVSAVGRNDLGTELRLRLRDLNLDASFINMDAKHPTGVVSVQIDSAGLPSYTIHDNVAWDFMRTSPQLDDLAARADIVCFGSLAQRSQTSRYTIRRFLGQMTPASLRIFDINLRQKFYDADTIEQSLKLANILKINHDELPVVRQMLSLPSDDRDSMTQLTKAFDLRLVALTRGEHGSILFDGQNFSDHPGHRAAQIADTVGAGDAFTAAIALGVWSGRPLDRINEAANKIASYVCTQSGATPTLPADLIREWG